MIMGFEPIGKIKERKPIHKPKPGNFEGIPIRPSKAQKRWVIDNAYSDNGYQAIFPNTVTLVYNVLAKYAHYDTQRCFPSYDTILKEIGLKRRNVVTEALKILEMHGIIYIQHSKGWSPNEYFLLDLSKWKTPSQVIIDTVMKRESKPPAVSENTPQQYQGGLPNDDNIDTRSQIKKSDNEIKPKIEKNERADYVDERPVKTDLPPRLAEDSQLVLMLMGRFGDMYGKKNVIDAIEEVSKGGFSVIEFPRRVKALLELRKKE